MPNDTRTPALAESTQSETQVTPVPASSAPRKRGRPTAKEAEERKIRAEQYDFLIGATLAERAYCVALVRLLRENYWLSEALRQILDQEALCRYNWTLKTLRDLLDQFATLDTLAHNASRLGNKWSNHPVLRAVRAEIGDSELRDYKSAVRIQELIESAHKR